MKLIIIALLCFSLNSLFSQETTEDLLLKYISSDYCDDFSNYGGTKIDYDVFKVVVILTNISQDTIFYDYANFQITGAKGGCGTNFAQYSGKRGFPSGEKIEKTFYVYTEKSKGLDKPQWELRKTPKGSKPQESYTEFASSCVNIPQCNAAETSINEVVLFGKIESPDEEAEVSEEWTVKLTKLECPKMPQISQYSADMIGEEKSISIIRSKNGNLIVNEGGYGVSDMIFKKITENKYQYQEDIFTKEIIFTGGNSMDYLHIANPNDTKMYYYYSGTKNPE